MIVLTLVHGTFGRGFFRASGDAPWTKDSSKLCQALRERFGPEAVVRPPFRWSGANSHTARMKAAECLRGYLRDGFGKYPDDATHFVIAHSHGGNVAVSAIEASDINERLAGLACLATPFISVRKRDLGDIYKTFVFALMAVAFALMWLLDSLLASSLSEHWRRLVGAALGFGVLFGAGLPLFMVAKEHAEELRRQLTPHLPQPDRLLIIRSPADEASGFLAVFQFISQITVRSFLLAQSGYARFERLALRLASHKRKLLIVAPCAFLLSLVFLVGFAESTHGDAPNPMTKAAWLTGWAISLLVAALATYLVIPGIGAKGVGLPLRLLTSALLWPMMIALSILLVIPFGWQTAVANLFLDVTVDATPVGSWEVHLVRPPTSEELGRPVPPLLHVVYENPRALEKLSEWMAARLESKGKVEPGRS